jgi:hypothetical protein
MGKCFVAVTVGGNEGTRFDGGLSISQRISSRMVMAMAMATAACNSRGDDREMQIRENSEDTTASSQSRQQIVQRHT